MWDHWRYLVCTTVVSRQFYSIRNNCCFLRTAFLSSEIPKNLHIDRSTVYINSKKKYSGNRSSTCIEIWNPIGTYLHLIILTVQRGANVKFQQTTMIIMLTQVMIYSNLWYSLEINDAFAGLGDTATADISGEASCIDSKIVPLASEVIVGWLRGCLTVVSIHWMHHVSLCCAL